MRNITNAGKPIKDSQGVPVPSTTLSVVLISATGMNGRPTDAWDVALGERILPIAFDVPVTNGIFAPFPLWPNSRGEIATQYLFSLDVEGVRPFRASVNDGVGDLQWIDVMSAGIPLSPVELQMLTDSKADAATSHANALLTAGHVAQTAAAVLATGIDRAETLRLQLLTAESERLAGIAQGQVAVDAAQVAIDKEAARLSAILAAKQISTVPGPAGSSAYQLAVSGGYVGTEAAWLLSIKGADGPAGVVTAQSLGDTIAASAAKTVPVDADMLPLMDSIAGNVLKRFSWAALKAFFGDVVSAGKAGGQTINGGTAAGENLTLSSTSNPTKGKIYLGPLTIDEPNGNIITTTGKIQSTLPAASMATTYAIDLYAKSGRATWPANGDKILSISHDVNGSKFTLLMLEAVDSSLYRLRTASGVALAPSSMMAATGYGNYILFVYSGIDMPTAGINFETLKTDNLKLSSYGADSATAIGLRFNTITPLQTAGAKLLSLQNNGVEKYAVDKDGAALATQYNLSALNTAPTSATAAGVLGEIRVTAGFIYVCTATNTWVRSALTTW